MRSDVLRERDVYNRRMSRLSKRLSSLRTPRGGAADASLADDGPENGELGRQKSKVGFIRMMSSKARKGSSAISRATHSVHRFRFDCKVLHVEGLVCNEPVYVGIFRGEKEFSCKAQMVDRSTNKVVFDEIIRFDATLFRPRNVEGAAFEEKEYKVALKTNSDGKTIGKIHLNFADYAIEPSGSKKFGAKLSNGALIVMHVESSINLGPNAKRNTTMSPRGMLGSRSMSSATSVAASEYAGSSMGGDDFGDMDDLKDLGLDDDDGERESQSSLKGKSAGVALSAAAMSPRRDSDSLKRTASERGNGPPGKAGSEAVSGKSGRNLMTLLASPRGRRNTGKTRQEDSAEKVMKRIAYLEKRNEELRQQNQSLRDAKREEGAQGMRNMDDLRAENAELQGRTKDLNLQIAREPELHDLVHELKEVKVALAMADYEKEQYRMEFMKVQKLPPPSVATKKRFFRR
ncbi:hypothetical protein FVE85_2093 [Porphyridium purpureum]|uniref:C2 NT-type domain-containing protein n=1 Tax=Porphyridium purpureum TaxID=35688 RepID=A0A5J4YXT2_PORPP|nr:hypothetical protein FVE85_2093 [Porphyridium purpureum]|eukprot:POR6536..scf209_3